MESKRRKIYLDIFFIGFFLLGLGIFIGRKINKSETKNVSNFPITEIKLSFDTLISLGQVSSLKPVFFKGNLKNIGNKELHISNLKTSCGCTQFDIKKLIIQPLDSTEISFSIKPIDKGKDFVNIYFDANTEQIKHKIKLVYEAIKP